MFLPNFQLRIARMVGITDIYDRNIRRSPGFKKPGERLEDVVKPAARQRTIFQKIVLKIHADNRSMVLANTAKRILLIGRLTAGGYCNRVIQPKPDMLQFLDLVLNLIELTLQDTAQPAARRLQNLGDFVQGKLLFPI